MKTKLSRYISIVIFFLAFYLIQISSDFLYQTKNSIGAGFIAPPKYLTRMSFGYREMIADSLWLRVIQDIGTCDQKLNSKNGESIVTKDEVNPSFAKAKPVIDDQVTQMLDSALPPANCEKGWVYQMIDAITDLAPKFDLVYRVGATILSVVVDDREGARLLFEKGVKRFPEDWSLAYRAGYHYLYEIRDTTRAAELLEHAGRIGAPPWVFSLAARLYTDLGKAELGITILEDALQREYKGVGVEKMKLRLQELYKLRDKALQEQASKQKASEAKGAKPLDSKKQIEN